MRTITRFSLSTLALFALTIIPATALAATVQVSVLDNSFSPQNVNINPGDTVVWTNYGSLSHSIAADSGVFESSTLNPGVNFAYTFNNSGTYAYHDPSYGSAGGVGMAGTVNIAGQNVVTGVNNSSGAAASLQAEAQSLLAEIAQLQAQLGATGSSGAVATTYACPTFGERVLSLGSSGSDVSQLQQYLASNPSIYPDGVVSGYFGALTQAAVQRWQATYGVVSSGSPATTGWGVVGPRTAAAISQQCASGSSSSGSIPTSAQSAPTAAGVIQVTPTSGAAPLTVSVVTTVNAMSSCAGITYVLNFGDGAESTAIPTRQGNCAPVMQTYTHTYTYGGTYTIVLAGGTHQTTALVTVAGNPSPAAAAASGIPADSLTASITSGAAPLTVVFTGTVSSISSYGCTGTCTDTINFGDGAIGLVQIPTASGTWQSYTISHTYASNGNYTAQLESASGSAEGSAITITVGNASDNSSGGSYSITSLAPNSSTPLLVTATFTVPSGAMYQLNWGDSSAISTQTAATQTGGNTITASHTYAGSGSYTVSVNNGTGNVQASAGVSVSSSNSGAPTISSISPTSGANGTSVTIKGAGFLSSAANTIYVDGVAFVSGKTSSSSGTSITFTMNKNSADSGSSWYGQAFSVGTHQISVSNSNGTSNTIDFTITR
jgi:plastocyanin/peptidoglycan hydrolase-like protein with peptidoglycan-binding domain